MYESLQEFFYKPVDDMLRPFILQKGNFEAIFDAKFRLGPGCLYLMLAIMDGIYQFLNGHEDKLSEQDSIALLNISNSVADLSQLLLHCLLHMRLKHPRSVWDPSGFGDFYEMYTKHEDILEVSIFSFPLAGPC